VDDVNDKVPGVCQRTMPVNSRKWIIQWGWMGNVNGGKYNIWLKDEGSILQVRAIKNKLS